MGDQVAVARRSLLLVDGDAKSQRVLEVSLRKAGFNVTTAESGSDALEKVHESAPDLVISDTQMAGMDGYDFCREFKKNTEWAAIPFIFLTKQTEIENKIRGLELGVDDYLTKPIYIKEVVTRVKILLQKHDRAAFEAKKDANMRFAGMLSDMGVVDLIQTIEVSRKTGVIHFTSADSKQASLFFRDGAVIDAEAGHLQGEDAIYRLLTWTDGEFEALFRPVRRKSAIEVSSQGLLMEGMRRLDEWGRLLEQLPPLENHFQVDYDELWDRLSDLPDEINQILRLFDTHRSLAEVIDAARFGDLETVEVISQLFFEGIITEIDSPTQSAPKMIQEEEVEESTIPDAKNPPPMEGLIDRAITEATPMPPTPRRSTAKGFPVAKLPITKRDPREALAHNLLRNGSEAQNAPTRAPIQPSNSVPMVVDPLSLAESPLEIELAPSTREIEPGGDLLVLDSNTSSETGDSTLPKLSVVKTPPADAKADFGTADTVAAKSELTKKLANRIADANNSESIPQRAEADASALSDDEAAVLDTQKIVAPATSSRDTKETVDPGAKSASSRDTLEIVAPATDKTSSRDTKETVDPGARSASSDEARDTQKIVAPELSVSVDEVSARDTQEIVVPQMAEVSSQSATEEITVPPVAEEVPTGRASDTDKMTIPSVSEALLATAGLASDTEEITAPLVANPASNDDKAPKRARATGAPKLITVRDERPTNITRPEPVDEVADAPDTTLRWVAVAIVATAVAGYALTRDGEQKKSIAAPNSTPSLSTGTPTSSPNRASAIDAASLAIDVEDAAVALSGIDAGIPDARPMPVDAAWLPDAATVPVVVQTVTADAGVKEQAKAALKSARRALRAGDRADALLYIDESLDLRKSSSAMTLKVDIFLKMNLRSEAQAAVEALTQSFPRRAASWRLKGTIHYEEKQYAEARKALSKYLELAPRAKDAEGVRALLESL